MSNPIIFAVPADIELAPSAVHPDWITEGTPQARAKRLAQSADGAASVYAWSCTAGRFIWHYSVDEMAYIVAGEVFVTDHQGTERRLGPGDMAFFPAGSQSQWYVPQEVRKLAVCRHNMPRPLGFLLRCWNKAVSHFASLSGGKGKRRAQNVISGAASLTSRQGLL